MTAVDSTDMLPSVKGHTRATIATLFAFLHAQGQSDYLGERVTQLQHSLQCAYHATKSPKYGSDLEVIVGALLHDVGRFIPVAEKMGKLYAPDGRYIGRKSHEVLGESYLRQIGFSERVCQLVGGHVMAKRYLVATDKTYHDGLSETSKRTLHIQGGGFTPEQVLEAQKDPWLEEKLAVRRWDDLAKDPKNIVPGLEAYEELVYQCLLEYRVPTRPTVVVCIDGFDPEYLEEGFDEGFLPTLKKFAESGFHTTAKSCMPSFTNPNNVSIITGAPPAAHGIAGNFFLDRETGEKEMITDDSLLRGSTLLEQMFQRGVRVAAITAKDKLRKIIGNGLKGAICFSAERSEDCSLEENGIEDVEKWLGQPAPSQYSGELSLFVLDAGIKLLQEKKSDFLYLTLSDFIQHKHAPGDKEASDFMKAIDDRLEKLSALAPAIGVTGDHGMSKKSNAAGEPNVLFLEQMINAQLGVNACRVICPITDPFVRHHGALGSFVRVYLKDIGQLEPVLAFCSSIPEVEEVLSGEVAASKYEMPADREGDIVVISKSHAVIGSKASDHDLSSVRDHPLRSHGGLSEQDIPLITSTPLKKLKGGRQWRNYDIFDLVLNLS
ncbi:Alkaline phosphatase-like alpha/beta/alpha [Penicillium macrosclerotiorum]|uniref:Alkaline phosphatase-like alpha/beta/alpha n=1 Tax=Penicillium macrosclerotiorum TaxID=303699 RepID=UPI0025485352|nr:Alkaline phosphatase-like alpha/beta/alpha [Penicillium macrosclerotiorum]KAJ5669157.1 Alkaline phosphatase-like alpha/beta/alpha [Penicillium macrosclerotiorum]